MKKIFYTVGPGQLYPGMKKFIESAYDRDIMSISHRSAAFSDLFKDTKESLFNLLHIPDDYHMFLTGSGLEAMERTVQNLVLEKSVHFTGGSFARKWAQFSEDLGKEVIRVEAEEGKGFDLGAVRLPKRTDAIFITLNETSTGVYLGDKFVRALRARHPEAMIAVDMVSAAPYADLDMKSVDAALFSVQKGFGLPAGMGVLIVSPRALSRARTISSRGISTGTYHSFAALEKMALKHQTPETPNILSLFLLNKVLGAMHKKGIGKIRQELRERSKHLYVFFDRHPTLTPFVANKNDRSPLTIVVNTPEDSSIIIKRLAKRGTIVSSGYGPYKNTHIRIANYPAHAANFEIKSLLRALPT